RLSEGDPIFYEAVIFIFGVNGLLLFALVTHYLDLWDRRWVRIILAVGGVGAFIVSPIAIVLARVDTRLVLTDIGRNWQLTPAGKIGYLLLLSLLLTTTAIIWRYRSSKGGIFLSGTVIVLIGTALLLVPVINQVHTALIAVSISSVLFTRA